MCQGSITIAVVSFFAIRSIGILPVGVCRADRSRFRKVLSFLMSLISQPDPISHRSRGRATRFSHACFPSMRRGYSMLPKSKPGLFMTLQRQGDCQEAQQSCCAVALGTYPLFAASTLYVLPFYASVRLSSSNSQARLDRRTSCR